MGWREDVVTAFRNLDGEADLADIYAEIEGIRSDLGRTWQATVRRTIEENSSDSQAWSAGSPDLFKKVGYGRWALRSSEQYPNISEIIDRIDRQDIKDALTQLSSGVKHAFGESTKYDVMYEGDRYPPKAVIGLATRRLLGRSLAPDEFSGGMASQCFRVLKEHGFDIVDKSTSRGIDSNPITSMLDKKVKYWAIALGKGGELWKECQEKGFIAIGWDGIGDLSKYSNQEAISDALMDYYEYDTKPNNKSRCCWQFLHEMKKGDIVIAKMGLRRLCGVGTVESDYIYDSSREKY